MGNKFDMRRRVGAALTASRSPLEPAAALALHASRATTAALATVAPLGTTAVRASRASLAAAAALATLATLAGAAVLAAPASAGPEVCVPNNVASGTKLFEYTGAEETWVVPKGVQWVKVTVLGGAGGQEKHSAPGGKGSGVNAYIRVTEGDCLYIQVGGYGAGHGGYGYSHGGDHGYVTGGGSGYSGGGGGGASAVRGGWSMVVAGGGGGGGGNGDADFNQGGPGGAGGNGGPPPTPAGEDAPHANGGKGGCGACARGTHGEPGQNAGHGNAEGGNGAGGGGGAGIVGGGGGAHGEGWDGGGGGGGGESYAGKYTAAVGYFNGSRPDGNGEVIITWPATPPLSALAGASALAPPMRDELAVSPAGKVRVPLTCARGSGRCRGALRIHGRSAHRPLLAHARYSVPAGHRSTVTARLTAAGRAALRRDVIARGALRAGPGARTPRRVMLLGGVAPATAVVGTRLRADRDGRVRVRLSCPPNAAGGCHGRLRLRSLDGARSDATRFRLAAGRTGTVTVRLDRAARRSLARHSRLDLLATATTRVPVGIPTRRIHDVRVTAAR